MAAIKDSRRRLRVKSRQLRIRWLRYFLRNYPYPMRAVIMQHSEFYLHRLRTNPFDNHLFIGKLAYVAELQHKGFARNSHYYIYYGSSHQPVVRIRWSTLDFRRKMDRVKRNPRTEKTGILADIHYLKELAIEYARKHKVVLRDEYDSNVMTLYDQPELVILIGGRIAVRIPYIYLIWRDSLEHR